MSRETGTFKTEDICAIIEACGKAGVRSFSLKDLKLSFEAPKSKVETPTTEFKLPPPEIQKLADSQTKEAETRQEFAIKKDELEHLLIEDPDAYFDAIRLGDLVDEKGT